MISAGRRDTLIRFERDTGTDKNDHGDKIENWTLLAEEWASVRFGGAEERRQAAQEQATQSATFRVLANDRTLGLTPLDRIAGYLGATWDVIGVAPVSRREVEVTAVRKAS